MKMTGFKGLRTIKSGTNYIALIAVTLMFGGLGSILFTQTHAATPVANIQAENGTISAAASTISDASASGLSAVKFDVSSGTGTQTNNCVPVPHLCGFPDATNTGVPAGISLTNSGSITVNTNGATIQNLNITGCIDVEANNVTIKNVKITCSDYFAVQNYNGHTGLTVQDSEIIGTSTQVSSGIIGSDFTALRVNIHGTADGIDGDGNVTVQDSYIHDLASGADTHNDDYQNTGAANTTIRHNTFFNKHNAASCVMFGGENGSPSNVLITNNLLDGGSYSIYLDAKGTNRVVSNNRIGRDFVAGPYNMNGSFTATANVWDDTGASNVP